MWTNGRVEWTVELRVESGDEVEFVSDVSDAGDAGGEVDGTPLDLFVVSVHVPKARDGEFAGGVEDLRAVWNVDMSACACSLDYAILDEDDGVGDGRRAGGVFECCANDGEPFGGGHSRGGAELGEGGEVGADASSDESSERRFIGSSNGLKVVEFSVCADEGDEILVVVEPEGFLAPDEAGDGVAVGVDGGGIVVDGEGA